MAEATVTRKGQITIPVDIRQAMGRAPQDRVVFTRLANGTVVMRARKRSHGPCRHAPVRPAGRRRGHAHRPGLTFPRSITLAPRR